MIKKHTSATLTLALAVLAVSADVSALTLGRVRGAALLGQGLDVTVPVQSDSDDELVANCFAADVFYGDVRIEAGFVTLTTQPGTAGKAATVRVVSTSKVDEPVVSLYLKTVCAQKSSRKYVLLADMVTDSLPAPSQTVPLSVRPASAAVNPPLVPSLSASLGEVVATGGRVNAKRTTKPAQSANRVGTPALRSASGQPAAARRAHLKLAPLDMFDERDLLLRATPEMVSTPVEDLQKRVEALAMWRALNASGQDVLRDEARMQALESDLKRLGELTARNKQSLQEVTGRLEQSESQRYSNPLVYGLAVALIACLAGLALLWQRLRKDGSGMAPWWGDDAVLSDQHSILKEEMADEQGAAPPAPSRCADPEAAVHQPAVQSQQLATTPVTGLVDIDLDMGESIFSPVGKLATAPAPIAISNLTQPAQLTAARLDFQPSTSGALRAINTKEMLDVRQQADFFMTLGQYEEAIRLLVTSIQSSEDSNPLLYLDLLKIFHNLSRKAEFDNYRAEFNRQFTGVVPVYADFNSGGSGLDAYPAMCKKISDLWPSDEAVQFIERCLVRSASESPDHGLDLEAFRDLLMLHAVSRRLDSFADSGMVPFSTARPAPGAFLAQVASAQIPAGLDLSRPGVDLDLSTGGGNLIDFDISDHGLGNKDDPETEAPTH